MRQDNARLTEVRSALAVVAHPDDESFGLGAVLDNLVRNGAEVSVLCFSHGRLRHCTAARATSRSCARLN